MVRVMAIVVGLVIVMVMALMHSMMLAVLNSLDVWKSLFIKWFMWVPSNLYLCECWFDAS